MPDETKQHKGTPETIHYMDWAGNRKTITVLVVSPDGPPGPDNAAAAEPDSPEGPPGPDN